jgi:serine protease Do
MTRLSERHVISTIKKVIPAVVSIMVSKHLEDLERELAHEVYPFLPGHHHEYRQRRKRRFSIPDLLVDSKGMVDVGGGTGFIVSATGLILTNRHVIADPGAEYTVIMNDGGKWPAAVLSCDPINDIAILKIPDRNLPVVKLGDATELELGQGVIAIGNALGLFKNTVSMGIISGLSRSIATEPVGTTPAQELRGLIQTDAAINPGNSGGPLVDLSGHAVGVNAAIAFEAQSIGFAIPINAAHRDLEDVKKYGHVRRPYLGIRYVTVDKNLQEKMHLSADYGALIITEGPHDHGVVPGSPAHAAGLQEHDIVLECNGKKITPDNPIQDVLDNLKASDRFTLLIRRGRRQFERVVKLAERK